MSEYTRDTPVVVKEDDNSYTVKFRGRWITKLTCSQATDAYEMGAIAYNSGREAVKEELRRLIGARS